jgi:hypothetical protein
MVTFSAKGRPALVAASVDSAPWQVYMPVSLVDGNDGYSIPIFKSVDLLVVCELPIGSLAREIRTQVFQDLDLQSPDCTYADVEREQLVISVHNDRSSLSKMQVYDASAQSTQAIWSSTVLVPKPRTDIILYDQDRLTIARDIVTSNGPAEASIDLANGLPFQVGRVSSDTLDTDEVLYSTSVLETKNGTVVSSLSGDGSYRFADDQLIGDEDHELLTLQTLSSQGFSRFISNDVQSLNVADWTWLPKLQNVAIDSAQTAASFDFGSKDYTLRTLSCHDGQAIEQVFESPGVAAGDAAGRIEFEESVPGWNQAWSVSQAGRTCDVAVVLMSGSSSKQTSFSK